jgi:hypothetical protein
VLKYSIKNIVLKQNKVSIMLDKSTTVSDKIVPIACSRTAVGESTYQGLLISKFKTVKFRAKTNSIYDSLVDLLQKYGLSSFFFFFFDGTTAQCGPSPPYWTSPSQLCFSTSF